eukprot:scaffold23125_cov76-Phaeocystis_antarctica.AAC.1
MHPRAGLGLGERGACRATSSLSFCRERKDKGSKAKLVRRVAAATVTAAAARVVVAATAVAARATAAAAKG